MVLKFFQNFKVPETESSTPYVQYISTEDYFLI